MIVVILGMWCEEVAKHYHLCCLSMMSCSLRIVKFYFSGLGVLTRPLAIFAALLTALSLAFLNDRFFFIFLLFLNSQSFD